MYILNQDQFDLKTDALNPTFQILKRQSGDESIEDLGDHQHSHGGTIAIGVILCIAITIIILGLVSPFLNTRRQNAGIPELGGQAYRADSANQSALLSARPGEQDSENNRVDVPGVPYPHSHQAEPISRSRGWKGGAYGWVQDLRQKAGEWKYPLRQQETSGYGEAQNETTEKNSPPQQKGFNPQSQPEPTSDGEHRWELISRITQSLSSGLGKKLDVAKTKGISSRKEKPVAELTGSAYMVKP